MRTDPLLGAVAGGYRITSLLSRGGMGSVYRAEHALIGRPAAIKVLLPEMSSNRDMVQRFFNEAKATTAIKHPGIVEVFDFGYLPAGQAYIVMELLDGMTLAQRARAGGRMHEGEAAMILRSACGALAAAHATGVVHRDLKPDNIFLIADPDAPIGVRCKLLDFGIAKLTAMGIATSATKTGAVMGTPTYMSPEQCKGAGDVDARADLYSLGCIFYELVSGRPPFVCDGAGELLGSHLFVEPESPTRHAPGLTADAEALILHLLVKVPARRVQSARDLATRLTALAQAHGWAVASTDLDARMSAPSIAPSAPDERTQISVAPAAPTPEQEQEQEQEDDQDPEVEPPTLHMQPIANVSEHTEPHVIPVTATVTEQTVPGAAAYPAAPPVEPARSTAQMPTATMGRATEPMPMPMPPAAPVPGVSTPAPMPLAIPGVPTPMPMGAYVPPSAPMGAYVTPPPMAAYVPTPTTLSGAAREAAAMAPPASGKLRSGRIAIAFVLAGVAVGAIVFFASASGGGDEVRPATGLANDAAVVAPLPAPVPPAPTLPPTPTPTPIPTPTEAAATVDAAVAPAEPDAAAAADVPATPVDAGAPPAVPHDAALAHPAASHDAGGATSPQKRKPNQTPAKSHSSDTDLLEPKL